MNTLQDCDCPEPPSFVLPPPPQPPSLVDDPPTCEMDVPKGLPFLGLGVALCASMFVIGALTTTAFVWRRRKLKNNRRRNVKDVPSEDAYNHFVFQLNPLVERMPPTSRKTFQFNLSPDPESDLEVSSHSEDSSQDDFAEDELSVAESVPPVLSREASLEDSSSQDCNKVHSLKTKDCHYKGKIILNTDNLPLITSPRDSGYPHSGDPTSSFTSPSEPGATGHPLYSIYLASVLDSPESNNIYETLDYC